MTEIEHWHQLTLAEQLGNIGSEIGRAAKWQSINKTRFAGAVSPGLDLLDRTLIDPRWRRQTRRLIELARLRELFAAASDNDRQYHTSLADLEHYCARFALLARSQATVSHPNLTA